MKGVIITLLLCMIMFSFVSAEVNSLGTFPRGSCVEVKQTCSSCSYVNISIAYVNSSLAVSNEAMLPQGGGLWTYNFCDTETSGRYDITGEGDINGVPTSFDVLWFKITPNGKEVENVGQISVALIYLYLAIGLGAIIFGYTLLRNRSSFVSYAGLFIILVGCTFLFYDLHLANLYATTIAEASGAENVSTGIFVLVLRFIKLSPYIIAGIVAFASVRLLHKAIKNKKSSDGWDNDDY